MMSELARAVSGLHTKLDKKDARIAELEAENATLRLTGNEHAVNCGRHGEPIAYIPQNGPCPACQNEDSIGEERQVFRKRIAELEAKEKNGWVKRVEELQERNLELAMRIDELDSQGTSH